jgi:hypothetical protein
MANPVIFTLTPNSWNLVALNVTGGIINQLTTEIMLQTYRNTGDNAPTDRAEGIAFENEVQISSSTAIDVYVWSDDGGKLRVDL